MGGACEIGQLQLPYEFSNDNVMPGHAKSSRYWSNFVKTV